MTNIIYEASVYSRKVSYRNFKGEENTVELFFAVDPIKLMQIIASFEIRKSRSNNPAKRNAEPEVTDEQQLKFVRKLATESAGYPSDDGETWENFEGFEDSLAGKAFMTKLAASDGDRREFSQKVILDPFRAFVNFAKADESNTPKDVQQFETMLQQMENIFKMPDPASESIEDRRARLAAEMASLEGPSADEQA